MSQDERPEEEERQDELYAAFGALGGQLAWDELTRLRGSDECRPALVWQGTLLVAVMPAAERWCSLLRGPAACGGGVGVVPTGRPWQASDPVWLPPSRASWQLPGSKRRAPAYLTGRQCCS